MRAVASSCRQPWRACDGGNKRTHKVNRPECYGVLFAQSMFCPEVSSLHPKPMKPVVLAIIAAFALTARATSTSYITFEQASSLKTALGAVP